MKKKPLTNKAGDVRELTKEDMRAMRPIQEVFPPEFLANLPKRKRGERGPQKQPTKQALTVRYSEDVINYFKSTGPGWQKRMDEALKEWITNHTHAA